MLNLLESLPISIVLTVIVLLQLFFIAHRYSFHFQTYIKYVLLFLTVPTSFFLVRYLTISNRKTKTYEAITHYWQGSPVQDTDNQVQKLIDSKAYKQFQKNRQKNERQLNQEIKSIPLAMREYDIEDMIQELEEKQTEIFDF